MVKKLLIAAIAICLIFWISVCLLIPNPLPVASVAYIKAPAKVVTEMATNPAKWQRWWPGTYTDTVYRFRTHQYNATLPEPYGLQISIQTGTDSVTSHLMALPLTQDSVAIEWKTELTSGINPFTRIKKYNQAVLLKENFKTLLDSLSAFVTNRQKLYGLQIDIVKFTNPFMISTQATFTGYPTVENIYKTINTLRAFAKAQQAQAVDSPMINIGVVDANNYLLRAALPVDKKLPAGNGVEFKQMILGNTLRGTVMGGTSKTAEALWQMQNFIDDYRLTSPAIPFQLLVTNRQQQPDSSKWITRIYYPVF